MAADPVYLQVCQVRTLALPQRPPAISLRKMARQFIFVTVTLLCIALASLSGCGGKFPLEGTISVDEQPVNSGQIVFSPDADKGNKGPSATATIVNGQFSLLKGHRATPGPNLALVNDSENNLSYKIPVEIPKGGSTELNIQIDSSGIWEEDQ